MNEIAIDADLCHKDGLCAMACTYGIFKQDEKGTMPKIDKKIAGYAKSPIGRKMVRRALGRRGAATVIKLAPEMEGLVSLFKSGTDWILRKAPLLVPFCADSAGGSQASMRTWHFTMPLWQRRLTKSMEPWQWDTLA